MLFEGMKQATQMSKFGVWDYYSFNDVTQIIFLLKNQKKLQYILSNSLQCQLVVLLHNNSLFNDVHP
jgi:hypothetical protein